jgi:hypothetical protein
MSIVHRSYSTEIYRPRPEILDDKSGNLLIVATPWGPRSTAKKAIQIIQNFFQSIRSDREVTSPFSRLTCLTPLANDLRIAVKLANDQIHHDENKVEYLTGVEISVLAKHGNEVAWIQIGHPFMFVVRHNNHIIPMGGFMDLTEEFASPGFGMEQLTGQRMAPLPSHLLGADGTSDFEVRSFHSHPDDKFILTSRPGFPNPANVLGAMQPTLDQTLEAVARTYVENDAQKPFWLGIHQF